MTNVALFALLSLATASPAVLHPEFFISFADYPRASAVSLEEGAVGIRVEVSAAGVPTGCHVASSSGYRRLDEAACRLFLRRARFDPARDADGQAIASTHFQRIVWRIPSNEGDSLLIIDPNWAGDAKD